MFLISEFLFKKIKINADNFKEAGLAELFFLHVFNRKIPSTILFLQILNYIPFFKKSVLSFFLKKKIFLKTNLTKNYFKQKKATNLFFKKNYINNINFLNNSTKFENFFFFFLINKYVISDSVINSINLIVYSNSQFTSLFFLNSYFKKFFDKNKINNEIYFLNESKVFDLWFFIKNIYSVNTKNKFKIENVLSSLIETSKHYLSYDIKEFNINFDKKMSSLDKNTLKNSLIFNKDFIDNKNTHNDINFLINLDNSSIFFLKKNYLYNKGKFSRNRQTYKTGVYLCIWLTVLTVVGLYFYFYLMSMKFTYFFILFFFFISVFFYKFFIKKKNKNIEEHSNIFDIL